MLLFRALANNMAPMTNHDECWRITDESPYAFLLNISLFLVSTLWRGRSEFDEINIIAKEYKHFERRDYILITLYYEDFASVWLETVLIVLV